MLPMIRCMVVRKGDMSGGSVRRVLLLAVTCLLRRALTMRQTARRPTRIRPAACSQELVRIVEQIRALWPEVRIMVRGDAGFCGDEIMRYCEHNPNLDYVLGSAKDQSFEQSDRRGDGRGPKAPSGDTKAGPSV